MIQLSDFYISVGGSYEAVLNRLQSEQMIKRFLLKFSKDKTYNELKQAFADKDTQSAFLAAHTLKGTAANLGLDSLSASASVLTESLRHAETFPTGISTAAVDDSYYAAIRNIALLED